MNWISAYLQFVPSALLVFWCHSFSDIASETRRLQCVYARPKFLSYNHLSQQIGIKTEYLLWQIVNEPVKVGTHESNFIILKQTEYLTQTVPNTV